jgi:hypothetical protein
MPIKSIQNLLIQDILLKAKSAIENQNFNFKVFSPQEFTYVHFYYPEEPWNQNDGCNIRLRHYHQITDSFKFRVEFGFRRDLLNWNTLQINSMNSFLDTYTQLQDIDRKSNIAFDVVFKDFNDVDQDKSKALTAQLLARMMNDMRKLVEIVNNAE